MSRAGDWSGRKVAEARRYVAERDGGMPLCARCGRLVDLGDDTAWVVGHVKSRATRPDLIWEPTNWRLECRPCSDASGQAAVIEKARAEGARAALEGAVFPAGHDPGKPSPLPVSLSTRAPDWTIPEHMTWAYNVQNAPVWLAPHLVVPDDASPPLAMTPPHPRSTGSYGAEAIEWCQEQRGIQLRWWQRLAMVRQLEHDAAGQLVWFGMVESGSRRIGKSERLRTVALWRLERGPALFEPGQVVMHFGRDLGVVREVQERAWPWCIARWGKDSVKTGNGKEVVTHPNGSRWLAKTAAYTFDVHLGLADECWDVEPGRISEDLEPAALERVSAQVVLTSTSHRKATSLMKSRIAAALAAEPDETNRTLLLLWGIRPGADPFDQDNWREASAHWSEDRRVMIAEKLLEAQNKRPELDDPDPVGSWAHQYLNRWDLVIHERTKGEAIVDEDTWADLAAPEVPFAAPDSAAIESWFGHGVSLALGWLVDGRVHLSVTDHHDLAAARAAATAAGYRGKLTVGASLLNDEPGLAKYALKGEARTGAAAAELRRLIAEAVVIHDGNKHLTGQVLKLRTLPGPDGPRMASAERADAVKAAVWAVRAARAGRRRATVGGIVF